MHETLAVRGRTEYLDCEIEHHSIKTEYSRRNLEIYQKMESDGEVLSARDRFYYGRELFYHREYVEDGDIFENISRIVDDIFNNYIVRQGSVEPLFAQFCDGVRTRCGGLSQWGSVDLAEEGMTPYEILQYYYGGDINLVMNAPVGGNVASYPGRPLRRGDAGNDVQTLKRQLNRIGKNYPAIPALDDSFVFDEDMEEAVRVFQQIFNLAQDGIVGKATWYKIKQIYNGVKQLSELSSEGLTIPEVQRRYAEDLRLGDSGIDVRTVRFYLAFLGYFLPELPMISLSDDFDQELLDAVYTFQRVYGLPVDGVVDRETWNALQTAYRKVLAELPEEEKNAFCETLDKLYWRSKNERRAGFVDVAELVEKHKEENIEGADEKNVKNRTV